MQRRNTAFEQRFTDIVGKCYGRSADWLHQRLSPEHFLVIPVPILSDADYQRLADLRHILRRFTHFSTAAASREGLPSQQHQALLVIRGANTSEGMTIGHLAERLLIAPHSAAELVNRLEASGYVARALDSNDRRRQFLTLTPKAEQVLSRLSEVHLQEIRHMAPALIMLLENLRRGDSD